MSLWWSPRGRAWRRARGASLERSFARSRRTDAELVLLVETIAAQVSGLREEVNEYLRRRSNRV